MLSNEEKEIRSLGITQMIKKHANWIKSNINDFCLYPATTDPKQLDKLAETVAEMQRLRKMLDELYVITFP